MFRKHRELSNNVVELDRRRDLDEGRGAETLEEGIRQAKYEFEKSGYARPCLPPGDGPRHYHFRRSASSKPAIYATVAAATCLKIIALYRPYVPGFVERIGLYGRNQ